MLPPVVSAAVLRDDPDQGRERGRFDGCVAKRTPDDARSVAFQNRHSGIVTAEAADRATSYSPGPTQEDAGMLGCHTPALSRSRSRRIVGEPGPGKIAVKNVAARHPEFGFDIERRHDLDALLASSIEGEAGLEGLGEYRLQGP